MSIVSDCVVLCCVCVCVLISQLLSFQLCTVLNIQSKILMQIIQSMCACAIMAVQWPIATTSATRAARVAGLRAIATPPPPPSALDSSLVSYSRKQKKNTKSRPLYVPMQLKAIGYGTGCRLSSPCHPHREHKKGSQI